MYQVRKGWPSQAAIDEAFVANTGVTIKEGMVVDVKDGKASLSATPVNPAFVISKEPLKNTFTGLMSQCVIEFKNEKEPLPDGTKEMRYYFNPQPTTAYAAGDGLVFKQASIASVTYWVFDKAGSGDSAIARVLNNPNDNNQVMRINFFGAM